MAAEKIVTESALAALASDAKRAIYDVLPGGSATGNPCTFDTDIAVPLKSLIANIVASGGNGTPSTPIPIVGHSELNLTRCGVNLWDEETRNGYYNNSGAFYELATSLANKNPIKVKPNTTYYCHCGSAFQFFVFTYDSNGDFISRITTAKNATFTTPANCAYIGWCNGYGEGGTYANDISINSDSADTSYHAYNGTPYLVSFGQTVYGGEYDANAGKVVVTKGYIDLSTLDPATLGSTPVFYKQLSNVKVPASDSNIAEVIAECYTPIRYNGVAGTVDTIAINTSGYIYVNTGSALTIPSGTAVFTLTTPIEIDVSELSVETIVGVNNIISDGGGDIAVEYRESVEKYAEEHGGSATSLNSLSDVTLTTPASGDALIYDGAKWVNGDGTRHNYSTTEKVVGTWIDGSTIYEKTVNVPSITLGADIRVNHGISDFGSLVGLEGHIKYDSDWLPLPYFSLTASYQIMVGNFNATNFLYRAGDGFDVNKLSNFYVTVRYTKAS